MLPGLAVNDLVNRGVVNLVSFRQIDISFVGTPEGINIIWIGKKLPHFFNILLRQFRLRMLLTAWVVAIYRATVR